MNTISNLVVKSDMACSSTSSSSSYSGPSSPLSNTNTNAITNREEELTITTDFIVDPTSLAAINYGANDLSISKLESIYLNFDMVL